MVYLHYNKQLFHLPSVHSLYEEQKQQILKINYYILSLITHHKKVKFFIPISIKDLYNMLFYFPVLLEWLNHSTGLTSFFIHYL